MTTKYENLIKQLAETGTGTMKCFGNSMKPILDNPSTCVYKKQETYEVGDIVFARVKGRYIDAHLITKKGPDSRFLISNNHNHENGWTKIIYGRVVQAINNSGVVKKF